MTVIVKSGVRFSVIAPGGFVLLAAIQATAEDVGEQLEITSACDGEHSGPNDPHHRGEAYDLRTHSLWDKAKVLNTLIGHLEANHPERFFAFLEAAETDNEHIHCQVKKGTVYP